MANLKKKPRILQREKAGSYWGNRGKKAHGFIPGGADRNKTPRKKKSRLGRAIARLIHSSTRGKKGQGKTLCRGQIQKKKKKIQRRKIHRRGEGFLENG